MAETAAQRQCERRAIIKADPCAYEKHRKEDCLRKHRSKESVTQTQKRRLRQRVKAAVTKHRVAITRRL